MIIFKFFLCRSAADANRGIIVDEHEGKYLETESIHDKYALRPASLEEMCLVQMGMRYDLVTGKEGATIRKSGRAPAPPPAGQGWEGTLTVVTGKEGEDILLPDFMLLHNNKIMRLRKFDSVIRRYKFKQEKDAHEFFYSELLLFFPWREERELFPNDAQKCGELYIKVKEKVDAVKAKLFPHLNDVELGRAMVENFEFDLNPDVGAAVDAEGEQGNEPEAMAELAAEYEGLDPEDLEEEQDLPQDKAGAPFFRAPPVVEMDQLKEKTRTLCWEQMVVLQKVLGFCRDLTMARNSGRKNIVKPPLLIVHGGAGTGKSMLINTLSLWVQALLTNSGDDLNSPYLIRCAPTGMAASNIEGQTLHSTFKFRFGDDYQSLSDKARDQLRDHFKNVKVVVIDEMSMMKSSQLYHLHLRLCDLMQNSNIMGGVSVLLFGKLRSLGVDGMR